MKAKNLEDVYELTALQQGLLFHGLYAPLDGNYTEQMVLTFGGRLNPDAFWHAWQLVTDRHGALRTTFHWADIDKPVQAVHAVVSLTRDQVDWRGHGSAQQARMLAQALERERRRGFDLDSRPPVRITLYRTADDEWQISLRFSHLIVDGWSIGVLLSDFAAGYRAISAGRVPDLPPAGRYRDYVAWWKRQDPGAVEGYWRDRLAGYGTPPALALGPAPDLTAGLLPTGWLELPLGPDVPSLRGFAQSRKLTMHTLTQAAWTLVLARALGVSDMVVGTTFAHRPADLPAAESTVGCMVSTIPVRSSIDDGQPLLAWLHDLQDSIASGREHAAAGLGDFRRWSAVTPGTEMFESSVTFQNMPLPALTAGGEELELRGIAVDTRPHLPLALMVMPGDDLPMRLVYDRRRFAEADARLLLERTRDLLARIAAGPALTLGELAPRPSALITARPNRVPVPPGRDHDQGGEPRTETEHALAVLFAELLDVPAVGVHDDLVELGLHSLLGTRAANRIRERWKTPVPLRTLFEQPTVAQLAAVIETGGELAPVPGQTADLDLHAEVVLDERIAAAGPCAPATESSGVVVTGATGYLGTAVTGWLLRTTAVPVTCLVRAPSPDGAVRRVRQALTAAGLWQPDFADRISAWPANLAQHGFGLDTARYEQLAAEAGAIFHLGAVVNVLPPYRKLRTVNVGAMAEVMRLATTGALKRVHCVSPAELTQNADPALAGAEDALGDQPPHLANGYTQSKWVAERIAALALRRGVPVTVYRAARLIGSPECPHWKLGDVISELTRACVQLGAVPEAPAGLPVSPVDYVAAAMAMLSGRGDSAGGYFHLLAAEPVSFDDLAAAMTALGYPAARLSLNGWYAELVRLAERDQSSGWDLVLSVVGPWVRASRDGWREPGYGTARARASLGGDLPAPRVDAGYLTQCLTQLSDMGFVPGPDLMLAAR